MLMPAPADALGVAAAPVAAGVPAGEAPAAPGAGVFAPDGEGPAAGAAAPPGVPPAAGALDAPAGTGSSHFPDLSRRTATARPTRSMRLTVGVPPGRNDRMAGTTCSPVRLTPG